MGVVYKLKQEISDFIIQKKKEDHSLSCRKLVDIIEQTFRIQVSKSSVNAIIKEQALSNPVGRAAVFKAPKNFFIPQEKKNLLMANVVPFLKEGYVPTAYQEQQNHAPAEVLEADRADVILRQQTEGSSFIEEKSPGEEHKIGIVETPVTAVNLISDILTRPVEIIKAQSVRVWEDHGVLYQDAGTVFLRAALWEVAREPVLGALVKEWAGEAVEQKEPASKWEEGLFIPDNVATDEAVFFSREMEESGALAGLGKKNDLTVSEEVAWESAAQSLLATAGAVRLVTRNGKIFRLHPGLKEIYTSDDKENMAEEPLYKTMEMVADRLINNVKPFVSAFPLEHSSGEALFLEVTAALEGREDAIERIEVVGEDNKVLNVFEGLLPQRRGYIFLTDVKEIFGEKRGGILDAQETFVDPVSDERVSVGSGTVLIGGKTFIVAKENKEDALRARTFISNLADRPEKRDAVFQEAAGFFPYGNRERAVSVIKPVAFDASASWKSKGVLGMFKGFLDWLAEGRYFDTKDALMAAKGLSGYIKQKNGGFYIKLALTSGMSFEEEIKEAVRRINENVIFDRLGRRVFVSFA